MEINNHINGYVKECPELKNLVKKRRRKINWTGELISLDGWPVEPGQLFLYILNEKDKESMRLMVKVVNIKEKIVE